MINYLFQPYFSPSSSSIKGPITCKTTTAIAVTYSCPANPNNVLVGAVWMVKQSPAAQIDV